MFFLLGMKDETGEQFVGYFVPTDDTVTRRLIREAEEKSREESAGACAIISFALIRSSRTSGTSQAPAEEEQRPDEYTLIRNYNWNVKSRGENNFDQGYFVLVRNGAATYNEFESRVKLFRRRVGGKNRRRLKRDEHTLSCRCTASGQSLENAH